MRDGSPSAKPGRRKEARRFKGSRPGRLADAAPGFRGRRKPGASEGRNGPGRDGQDNRNNPNPGSPRASSYSVIFPPALKIQVARITAPPAPKIHSADSKTSAHVLRPIKPWAVTHSSAMVPKTLTTA